MISLSYINDEPTIKLEGDYSDLKQLYEDVHVCAKAAKDIFRADSPATDLLISFCSDVRHAFEGQRDITKHEFVAPHVFYTYATPFGNIYLTCALKAMRLCMTFCEQDIKLMASTLMKLEATLKLINKDRFPAVADKVDKISCGNLDFMEIDELIDRARQLEVLASIKNNENEQSNLYLEAVNQFCTGKAMRVTHRKITR